MDNNNNNNDLFDLGSEPLVEEFDPFAEENSLDDNTITNEGNQQEEKVEEAVQNKPIAETPVTTDNQPKPDPKAAEPTKADKPQKDNTEKLPVFEYAGATENIEDASKTFEELRIEKSYDFPELEDGKRVSWTVEYGKITKSVADPKGISIDKMKSDIETSKEFEDSLKKRGADKNPTCKIKPRVTAQSKGVAPSYKGVFTNMDEAETAGKVISIVPAKDGKVYEIRNTKMGKFVMPVTDCELLSNVQAGFIPALPLIPMDLMIRIVAFFRYYMHKNSEQEVLANVYWDKENRNFITDVPEQTVTKVSVESLENLDFAHDRYIHYMDIHSHNSMKAFFSNVDDNDEKATRLYTVIGNLHEYFPDIKTRISNGGKFLEIDPAEVFELVARPFPDEWRNNVHLKISHIGDKCGGGDDNALRDLDGETL